MKKRLNCDVIVTQPRRIAAISVAKRIRQDGNWDLGWWEPHSLGSLEIVYSTVKRETSLEIHLTASPKFYSNIQLSINIC
ncbi:hypothetical protein P5V15_008854 [Pogonomyrmex californicus]